MVCIGAVALKDEINTTTPESGWVSLKHGDSPDNLQTKYAESLKCVQEKIGTGNHSQPGLDTLLT